MRPCRGITWWAHRTDRPHALQIPARKGGKHSLAENSASPVQTEPTQDAEQLISRLHNTRKELKTASAFRMSGFDRALVGAAFLIAVSGFLSSDKIRVGGGFGWDG